MRSEERQSATISWMGISVLALLCWLAASAGYTAPLTVYGGLPSLEDVALSPDGSRIAYVRTEGNTRLVFVATVADQKLIRYARVGEEKLRSVEWADNDNILITTSMTSSVHGFRWEAFLVSVYNVPKNELRSLPGQVPGIDEHFSNVVIGRMTVRHVDGHTVVFVPAADVHEGLALVRCDLTSGLNRLERLGNDTSWLIDAQGQLAAQESYDAQTQRWVISVFRGGTLHEAASGHTGLDVPEMLGFGPTAETLLVESIEDGNSMWKLLSVGEGKFAGPVEQGTFYRPIFEPFPIDLSGE